jgi:hypothetical protein
LRECRRAKASIRAAQHRRQKSAPTIPPMN